MRFLKLIALSSLALLGITAGAAEPVKPQRILACNMNALTKEQRARHETVTKRLLEHATRKDLADGYVFTIDPSRVSVAELAEWVADESRCCPAVDFHVELPAFGPLTLRLDGGADVKQFIAAELGL
ncbi:MAG TPA: hypothetical protein VJZ00_13065 [Thermoanaerobaculia bacterium]|nr:hypothetical protein [Thermoanaerobaculia bacterium]